MIWVVGPVAMDYHDYFTAHAIQYGQFIHRGTTQRAKTAVQLDFTNIDRIEQSLKQLYSELPVTAVMVTGVEHYVVPAAVIANYFKVPAIPIEAAYAATDKVIMRQKFAAYDSTITPAFQEVIQVSQAEAFFNSQSGPVMLKPANLMKSLFVTKNTTLKELRHNYQVMQLALPKLYAQNHLDRPRILVESYIPGSMHTVAGFVDNDGNPELVPYITDCLPASTLGISDTYIYARQLPSCLSSAEQQAILEVTTRGVHALGLKNTPIHAELMYAPNGPQIIEIGARLGGYRPRMYDQAYGIDLYQAAIATALGKPVNIQVLKQQASAVIELFPDMTGRFIRVEQLALLDDLQAVISIKRKTTPGQRIGPAHEGFRAAMVINLAGSLDKVQAAEEIIRTHVRVLVKVAHI